MLVHMIGVRTIWMTDDSDNLGLPSASNLTIQTFTEVKSTSPELPSPTLITNAMAPEIVMVKRREWLHGVTNEASGSVSVETQKKRNEEMMRVPERFERLLADFCVS